MKKECKRLAKNLETLDLIVVTIFSLLTSRKVWPTWNVKSMLLKAVT